MKDYLPTATTKAFFAAEKLRTGTEIQDPRWQRCLRKVEATMGMALGALLVKDKISNADKHEVSL